MSTPGKSKAISNKNETAFSNESTMHGKTYREFSQHATCCIKKSSSFSLYLLVDRGSNSVVVGSEARFIETRSNRKVDIRGIDNHEITDIPQVTAGEVTSTIAS